MINTAANVIAAYLDAPRVRAVPGAGVLSWRFDRRPTVGYDADAHAQERADEARWLEEREAEERRMVALEDRILDALLAGDRGTARRLICEHNRDPDWW